MLVYISEIISFRIGGSFLEFYGKLFVNIEVALKAFLSLVDSVYFVSAKIAENDHAILKVLFVLGVY